MTTHLSSAIQSLTRVIRLGPDLSQWAEPAAALLTQLKGLTGSAADAVAIAERESNVLSHLQAMGEGRTDYFRRDSPRFALKCLRKRLDDIRHSGSWKSVSNRNIDYGLADRFMLTSASLNHLFPSISTLRESLIPREEPEAPPLSLLSRFQGRPESLKLFANHLGAHDTLLNTHCELHTWTEWLAMTDAAYDLYNSLGCKPLTAGSLHGWHDPRKGTSPLQQFAMGSGYLFQIWPGVSEIRSGLEFVIAKTEQGPLARVGVRIGPTFSIITLVQGVAKTYTAHAEILKSLLDGQDPFDWMIEGIALMTQRSGRTELRGYSYWYNGWIRNGFETGLLDESVSPHRRWFSPDAVPRIKKMYDDRFAKLGMCPLEGRDDLYARHLPLNNNPPLSDPTGRFLSLNLFPPPKNL